MYWFQSANITHTSQNPTQTNANAHIHLYYTHLRYTYFTCTSYNINIEDSTSSPIYIIYILHGVCTRPRLKPYYSSHFFSFSIYADEYTHAHTHRSHMMIFRLCCSFVRSHSVAVRLFLKTGPPPTVAKIKSTLSRHEHHEHYIDVPLPPNMSYRVFICAICTYRREAIQASQDVREVQMAKRNEFMPNTLHGRMYSYSWYVCIVCCIPFESFVRSVVRPSVRPFMPPVCACV